MDMATEERVRRDDRAHVFHSWSAQGQINPLPIAGGQGVEIWDYEGKRYIDFASQLVYTNLGHQHPRVVARSEQADVLCTIALNYANDKRSNWPGYWPN
jgi:taurine--2-oxoglutarate transaminase